MFRHPRPEFPGLVLMIIQCHLLMTFSLESSQLPIYNGVL